MSNRVKDLKFKRFGKLLVLDRISASRQGSATWKCLCDCGVEKILSSDHLTRKNNPVKSCGCRIKERRGPNHPDWKGCGLISGNWWYNHVLRNRKSARKNPPEVKVTIEYAWDLFEKQNGRCKLSDIELRFGSTTQNNTASLDRIDSSKGYIEGNVQWVHKDINFMKRTYDQHYFISLCRRVTENFT